MTEERDSDERPREQGPREQKRPARGEAPALPSAVKSDRRAREADALRANLQRRKAQQRARGEGGSGRSPDGTRDEGDDRKPS